MSEGETVTVTEAAAMLGVQKEKVARLIKQGVLTSRPSLLDARRRLIPRAQIERIIEDEGHKLATKRRSGPPRPRSIGIVADGTLQSTDIEEYLREHWRLELC